jgi:hypothetical protein
MGGMVALAIGGAVGAVFDEAPVRRSTTTTAPPVSTTVPRAAPLGEVGEELDGLVGAGRLVDHHAIYEVTDPALPEGLEQSVEVWRKGELFRADIVERAANGTRRQTAISGGPVNRSCETVNGVQTCETVDAVPLDLPGAFVAAVLAAVEEDEDAELEVRDEDVAGYEARCFSVEDVGELCLAGDGVMLRLVLQGATVLATQIIDDVPDTAFDTAG